MKKLLNKISSWSTTKKSLYFALMACVVYTSANLTLNAKGASVDDTLTERFFDFLQTIAVAGGALSGAKIVKDKKGVE